MKRIEWLTSVSLWTGSSRAEKTSAPNTQLTELPVGNAQRRRNREPGKAVSFSLGSSQSATMARVRWAELSGNSVTRNSRSVTSDLQVLWCSPTNNFRCFWPAPRRLAFNGAGLLGDQTGNKTLGRFAFGLRLDRTLTATCTSRKPVTVGISYTPILPSNPLARQSFT
jgi:hypothetical protein